VPEILRFSTRRKILRRFKNVLKTDCLVRSIRGFLDPWFEKRRPTMSIMNEYQRRTQLGDFGEIVVCEQLSKNGYQNCTRIGGNNECYDVEAYKGGQKHLFAIKTRNHTTHTGDIKRDYYNLLFNGKKGGDPYAKVQTALKNAHSQNAISMWATVRVDAGRQQYTICYGRVADLEDKRFVPMDQKDLLWHDKLAKNVFDPRIKLEWSNVKKKILPTPPRKVTPPSNWTQLSQ
jgi:hypothetical protein